MKALILKIETVTLPEPGDPRVVLACDRALGNGRFGEIRDIVFVRRAEGGRLVRAFSASGKVYANLAFGARSRLPMAPSKVAPMNHAPSAIRSSISTPVNRTPWNRAPVASA